MNFAGEGVVFGERPGTIRFSEPKRDKVINLLHSQYWKANLFTKRLEGTT